MEKVDARNRKFSIGDMVYFRHKHMSAQGNAHKIMGFADHSNLSGFVLLLEPNASTWGGNRFDPGHLLTKAEWILYGRSGA